MTYFAIPRNASSPAEAELASVLDNAARPLDGLTPVGLVLIAKDLTLNVVLLALAARLDIDSW